MTTITRETLELAALAAGKRVAAGYVTAHDNLTAIVLESGEEWRPHTNIADAARLAAHIDALVDAQDRRVRASAIRGNLVAVESMPHDGTQADRERAWCLAVTSVATQIGWRVRESGR